MSKKLTDDEDILIAKLDDTARKMKFLSMTVEDFYEDSQEELYNTL